jgi:hypothetical protein
MKGGLEVRNPALGLRNGGEAEDAVQVDTVFKGLF